MPSRIRTPDRTLTTQAPSRVDFAGGTLDLWPLYLFFPGSRTLNAAIDRMSRVRLESIPRGYELVSVDQDRSLRASTLQDLEGSDELPLLGTFVRHFAPGSGVRVITENNAPAGSGLGGSSSLAVALGAALAEWTGIEIESNALIRTVCDLEAQVLHTPTGIQDYYAAVHGGISLLHLEPGGVRHEALQEVSSWLGSRLVLCYTGAPHHSGLSNWEIYRRVVERDANTCASLEEIAGVAAEMESALRAADPERVAGALDREWKARKQLAPQVSTDRIEQVIGCALSSGALAAKVCGAGGGGCVLILSAEGRASEVSEALRGRGFEVLSFRLQDSGLERRWN